MCLAILTSEYLTIDLLGEYIDVQLEDGVMTTREVYDVFFTAPPDFSNRMLVLSPHFLLRGQSLAVSVSKSPGLSDPADHMCCEGTAYDCWNREGVFAIRLPSDDRTSANALSELFCGKVVCPTVELPGMMSQPHAVEFVQTYGTLFTLKFTNLEPGQRYMFRLEVKATKLLLLAPPRCIDDPLAGDIRAHWVQDATIIDPKTARVSFERLVDEALSNAPFVGVANSLKTLLAPAINGTPRALLTAPISRHRILSILPDNAEIERDNATGRCCSLGTPMPSKQHVANSRLVIEWSAGRKIYWIDDPEETARRVWTHLRDWAKNDPKLKEDITIAISGSHNNCSLVIDELVALDAIGHVDQKFVGKDLPSDALTAKLATLASSPSVLAHFTWNGFQIKYTFRYVYLDRENSKRLAWRQKIQTFSIWASIFGFIFGLIGMVVALLTWYFPRRLD